jgi:hypothetical protein
MLCDEEFRAEAISAAHALRHSVAVERSGEEVTVRTTRVLPAEVPDFAKAMVGDTIEVSQLERWGAADPAGGRTAQLSLEIRGQPAGMTGSARLEPVAGGTREVVVGEVSVRIPFMGRRFEPEIAKAIRAALAKEAEVGRRWLAERD